MVEATDIEDLESYLFESTDALDIAGVFEKLKSASMKHYNAFDSALKENGSDEGCCALGDEYCLDTDTDFKPDFSHGDHDFGFGYHGYNNSSEAAEPEEQSSSSATAEEEPEEAQSSSSAAEEESEEEEESETQGSSSSIGFSFI